MQLKKLKLVGFKSFVDPTTLLFDDQLVGVVGPNGCGKSNVIDAVRWVMGESSAKNLRGGSMADVIFNGSVGRKPVSVASVELIFDNSDGKVGGEYASYAEISIKREVSRDGQSNYFLNNVKCRRRDVTDIFLGTGLGPRSYSIIEQGMISKVIDAKPEDLRSFFEEAAGISVYKKRRHDTELRIRHTRENLDRIEDLIQEQERLLEKLKRQSRAAIKYKEFKEEKDVIDLQLAAMKWRNFDQHLQEHTEQIRTISTQIEEKLAQRASVDNSLTTLRVEHAETTQQVNEVQAKYYEIGADIARLEQIISHYQERKKQLQDDLDNTESAFGEVKEQIKEDQTKLDALTENKDALLPNYEMAKEALMESEEVLYNLQEELDNWNETWETFQKEAQVPQRNAEVQKTKIEQLEKQVRQAQINIDRFKIEKDSLRITETQTIVDELKSEIEIKEISEKENKENVDNIQTEINNLTEQSKKIGGQIDILKGDIQKLKGRRASLEELQRAALNRYEEKTINWLEERGFNNALRLAQAIDAEPGYEKAIETALGDYLEAICVDDLANLSSDLISIEDSKLLFLENAASEHVNVNENLSAYSNEFLLSIKDKLLSSKINSQCKVENLIANIYVAHSVADALELKSQLKANTEPAFYNAASVVTVDGIWLGANWVRVHNQKNDPNSGVIKREKELAEIKESLDKFEIELQDKETSNKEIVVKIKEFEEQNKELRAMHSILVKDLRELSSKLSTEITKLENFIERSNKIDDEVLENQENLKTYTEEVNVVRIDLEKSIEEMATFAESEEELEAKKETLSEELSLAQDKVKESKEKSHQLEMDLQTILTKKEATLSGLERLESNLASTDERRKNLLEMLKGSEPKEEEKNELEALLDDRILIEKDLSKVRDKLEEINQKVVSNEESRKELEEKIQDDRNKLDSIKMEWQQYEVRRDTIVEKFEKKEANVEDILKGLPEDAIEEVWDERLETLTQKIDRLGPINLAAIEEYKSESERFEYLSSQHEDLSEAMQTLENAIKKIDKETKAKFKSTFDEVNENFKALFPKLFGGGEAYLELTGEDLLDTGVGIMARPPGKRNSSIKLLSGGEKALTAVALVFAIFQLNPAPFCMLDEVDAPLDDSNVGRFCSLIKDMASKVQFIVITHNKITMEVAKQLTGVTMKEPGVSRLVSVDIDEAVEFVS